MATPDRPPLDLQKQRRKLRDRYRRPLPAVRPASVGFPVDVSRAADSHCWLPLAFRRSRVTWPGLRAAIQRSLGPRCLLRVAAGWSCQSRPAAFETKQTQRSALCCCRRRWILRPYSRPPFPPSSPFLLLLAGLCWPAVACCAGRIPQDSHARDQLQADALRPAVETASSLLGRGRRLRAAHTSAPSESTP